MMKGKKFKESLIINKKICITVIALVVIILVSKNVYAYLTHKDTVENNIVLGYNTISLQENYNPPLAMEKGISFTKEPYAVNTGNVDCYVRLKAVISDSRVADGITMDYNTEDYTYNSADGYWYYKNAITPGERTVPLFTTVSIDDNADDRVLDGFDVYVYAESVQKVDGKTMQETWDYFE